MTYALYPSFKNAVLGLLSTNPSPESWVDTPENRADLTSKVEGLWQEHRLATLPQCSAESSAELWVAIEDVGKGETKLPKLPLSVEVELDRLRGVLELIGRDVVVEPLINGEMPEPELEDFAGRKSFLACLSYRLDFILTLYEVIFTNIPPQAISLEPGALFIPILEELDELLSVEVWREIWSYVETRSKRFAKNMPASRGKALPLLRIINSFLRCLPRTPEDLVFRGRIHQFAGSVISVADKSAVNMRGDYNDIQTTWEEDERLAEDEKGDEKPDGEENGDGEEKMEDGVEGDVEMKQEEVKEGDEQVDEKEEGDGEMKVEEKKEEEKKDEPPTTPPAIIPESSEPDFYSTLWSLQQYFSNPPTLDGPPTGTPALTPFALFKSKTDFVLPRLFEQTLKEKATSGTEVSTSSSTTKTSTSPSTSTSPTSRKRKRAAITTTTEAADEDDSFFHPHYLTGRRLLSHELADPSFRRQILVQYFILFQFLLNLTPASAAKQAFTGGMPKTFVIGQEDQEWVKKKVQAIREELRKMGRDGKSFESTVLSVITRERHYAQWKNDGCPESVFDVAPLDDDSAQEAAAGWKRHCQSPKRFPYKLGSPALTVLWEGGFKDLNQLKQRKRTVTLKSLDEELKALQADEDDSIAMGQDVEPELHEIRLKNNWRGLRLASHDQLHLFSACKVKRDLILLTDAMINGLEKPKPNIPKAKETENGGNVVDTAVKTEVDVDVSVVTPMLAPAGDIEMAS